MTLLQAFGARVRGFAIRGTAQLGAGPPGAPVGR